MKNLKCSDDGDVSLFTVEVHQNKQKIQKSLDNLARTQEIRRTDKIWNEVKKFADEGNIDVSKVLGMLLTRCEGVNLKNIGRKIVDGKSETEKKEIPIVTALVIYCDCNLGRETCRRQRLLKTAGFPNFPSWEKVHNLQSISPLKLWDYLPHTKVFISHFLKQSNKLLCR